MGCRRQKRPELGNGRRKVRAQLCRTEYLQRIELVLRIVVINRVDTVRGDRPEDLLNTRIGTSQARDRLNGMPNGEREHRVRILIPEGVHVL
jgi:hypothetical protein